MPVPSMLQKMLKSIADMLVADAAPAVGAAALGAVLDCAVLAADDWAALREQPAVQAALNLPYSNGQLEAR